MDETPRPIAVLVDREGLGDVMLKTPFLRALRRAFPDNPVWWIATHQTSMADDLRPLFAGEVANVVADSGLDGRIGPPLERLRAFPPFERVFDARTRISTVAFARYGLRHHGFYCCLPGYALCDGRPPSGRTRPRHIAERMLSLVGCAIGAPADGAGRLTASADAVGWAREALPAGPTYVGIAPGSRQADKNWPMPRFRQLAADLAASGLAPAFFLGPQERVSAAELAAAAPGSIVLETAGRPSEPVALGLDRLVAAAQRLALLVANDNGVGHLMGAAGAPVLSLFGPTDPRRWRPVTPCGRVLQAKDFGRRNDMESIPVGAVADAARGMAAQAPISRRP